MCIRDRYSEQKKYDDYLNTNNRETNVCLLYTSCSILLKHAQGTASAFREAKADLLRADWIWQQYKAAHNNYTQVSYHKETAFELKLFPANYKTNSTLRSKPRRHHTYI